MEENRDDQLLSEIGDDLGKKLTLESTSEHFNDDDEEDDVVYVFNSGDDDDDEDEEGEFEFSFAGVEVKSPESAEVLFENGQIRPSFPFIVENSEETSEKFGPPVKKLFVVPPSTAEDGEWRAEESPAELSAAVGSSSPEFRRKSNSTGFSRFWRMKELLARSNSDGKDRFVFMPSSKDGSGGVEKEKTKMKSMMKVVSLRRIKVGKKNENNETRPTIGGGGGDKEGKKKGKKAASMSAAYEAFYGKKSGSGGSGAGGEKSSYLPYRVGFFTNASGMTRNVHPY